MTLTGSSHPTSIGFAAALCGALALPASAQVTEEILQAEKDWFRAKNHFLCSSISFARADGETGVRHRDAGLALGRPIVEDALTQGVTPQTLMPHLRAEGQILATSPDTGFALGRIYQDYELLFARRFLDHMEEAAGRDEDREGAAEEYLAASYMDLGCEDLERAD